MNEELHAEIKDKCGSLDTRLDEIGEDLRNISFNYKLIDQYGSIDQEVAKVYQWYDKNKKIIKKLNKWVTKYQNEKSMIEETLSNLELKTKQLNNTVQNIKLQEFSRGQHEDSCRR